MTGHNNRSNFLFGLTLTELAFILFFMLLFFSTVVINDKDKNIDTIKKKIEAYKVFEEIPEFNKKTIEEKTVWLKELVEKDKLNFKYQELLKNHKVLNDSYKNLVAAIPGLKDKTAKEKAKWLKELVEKNDLNIKNLEIKKELVTIKDRLENSKKELQLKNKQLAKLEKGDKGLKGLRHPFCWKNKITKKGEYIYDIIIGENGITTHRGYKPYLEKEFNKIPGSQEIIDTKNISISEFKEKTRAVFKWSKNAKPECRHLVRIFNKTTLTKSYINRRLRIEDYFYKEEYTTSYSEYKDNSKVPIDNRIIDKETKRDVGSSNRSSKQFNKKVCVCGNRNSISKEWKRLCEQLEIVGALNKNLNQNCDFK